MIWIAIGLGCGVSTSFAPWPWFAILGSSLLFRNLRTIVPLLLAFTVGFLIRPAIPELVREESEFEGRVSIDSMPQRGALGQSCLAEIGSERYLLYFSAEENLALGDEAVIQGELNALSESAGFSSGARGTIKVSSVRLLSEGFSIWRIGQQVADHFRKTVENHLSPESAALVRGVCFNQTDAIEQSDWEAFRRFGIVHLLSASGFHVFVVAGLLLAILNLIPIPRWLQIAVVLGALGLFAIAAGLRPPIIRSVLMTAVALPAYTLRREPDGLSAVGLASVVNILVNPSVIVELGFQLSVLSTLGLVMFLDERLVSTWPKWKLVLAPTLIATLATLPLIGFVFGEVSLIGVIGNLVIAPVVAAIIVLSLIAWILGSVAPPLGDLVWLLVEPLTTFTLRTTELGGTLPGSLIRLPGFSVLSLVLMYLLLLTFWRVRHEKS
ncbi:MAG: ComEC/Rec2 family competence protein [Fimbriimonadaceae bacterium]|nr:MAG: ComEC/Rec2 family competence protein [Fimbriimonadaceae bacterium]